MDGSRGLRMNLKLSRRQRAYGSMTIIQGLLSRSSESSWGRSRPKIPRLKLPQPRLPTWQVMLEILVTTCDEWGIGTGGWSFWHQNKNISFGISIWGRVLMRNIWVSFLLPYIHIYRQIHNCNNANISHKLLSCSGSTLQIRADFYEFVFPPSVQAEHYRFTDLGHAADESKLLQGYNSQSRRWRLRFWTCIVVCCRDRRVPLTQQKYWHIRRPQCRTWDTYALQQDV